MFPNHAKLALSALSALTLLSACESAGLVSRETFAACAAQVGIVGDYTISPARVSDGRGGSDITLQFVPDANTSQVQADAGNACLVERLSAASGLDLAYAPLLGSRLADPEAGIAVTPRPAASGAPAAGEPMPSPASVGGQCSLEMTGGAGYTCR